jgi:Ca2+-binding RTX toxin-like protein
MRIRAPSDPPRRSSALGGAIVATLATLWLVVPTPALAQLSFTSSNFSVGDAAATPIGLAISDLNGDSHLDLAVANSGYPFFNPGGVPVLLGDGKGSFTFVKQFNADTRPWAVAAADFNSDTHPDIAVLNFGSSDVSVLRGVGDGTFAAPNNLPVGGGPTAIVAAFLNSDGHPDLATANSGSASNNVSVLLGKGDGTFSPATNFPVGRTPDALAAGDVNADSNLDLVTGNGLGDNASVLLGNGDGSFSGPRTIPSGQGPESVSVGDFDGDPISDLAFAGGDSIQGGAVDILLGAGAGSFSGPTAFGVGATPATSVAVADFNADAVSDLAVTVPEDVGSEVKVLLGVGNGTFNTPLEFAADSADSISVGNFNADPLPDMVTTDIADGQVTVLLRNRPAPSPAPAVRVVPGGSCGSGGRQASLRFRLADAGAPVGRLALSVASSNHALVPARKMRLAGRGARRTLTARAVAGRRGSAIVRVGVGDGRSTRSVRVRVHVGGKGIDRLAGGPRTDVILGQGGADRLAGRGGNDLLCGGNGADRMGGGRGADVVFGQDGRDRLAGQEGNDVLCGGKGADRLNGGNGADRVAGGRGQDRVNGEAEGSRFCRRQPSR